MVFFKNRIAFLLCLFCLFSFESLLEEMSLLSFSVLSRQVKPLKRELFYIFIYFLCTKHAIHCISKIYFIVNLFEINFTEVAVRPNPAKHKLGQRHLKLFLPPNQLELPNLFQFL